jgi:hypothetical protein
LFELQGGIEMVKSKETDKFYVTARKASFHIWWIDLSGITTELPGKVEKANLSLMSTPSKTQVRLLS